MVSTVIILGHTKLLYGVHLDGILGLLELLLNYIFYAFMWKIGEDCLDLWLEGHSIMEFFLFADEDDERRTRLQRTIWMSIRNFLTAVFWSFGVPTILYRIV
jgi:hypothetical protein